MPKVGDLPKPMFAKRKTIEKKTLKRVQHGPSAGNSPAEINAIQVGMRVLHEKFGYGTVKHIEGENNNRKAVVFFDNIGEKQLLLRFAKLSIVQ